MAQKKSTAVLLALVIIAGVLFGGIPASYAASGEQTTSDRYVSELHVQGPSKDGWAQGETVTLGLSVGRQDEGAFGMRLYDTTITFDTAKFSLVRVNASAAAGDKLLIQDNYKPSGNTQQIKLTYSNIGAGASDAEGRMEMATITLRVKQSAAEGTAAIGQVFGGMSDAQGSLVKSVEAAGLQLKIEDGRQGYRYGLEIAEGAKAAYQEGDTLTVSSFLNTDGSAVSGAAVTVAYDEAVFEAVEGQSQPGVTQKLEPGKITLLYVAPKGAEASQKLPLGTFVLTVKQNAQKGTAQLTQTAGSVNVNGSIRNNIPGDSLSLTVLDRGSCQFALVPRETESSLLQGETLILDVVVTADQPVEPRMIAEEVTFDKEIFTFVTASAVSAKTTADGREGVARWVYSDIGAAGTSEKASVITLGSLVLKVKNSAPDSDTVIAQNESNLVVKSGGDIVRYDKITADGLSVTIGEIPVTGVSVSGTVSYAVGDISRQATVVLDDGAGTRIESASGEEFLLENVPAGTYTLTVTAESHTVYTKKNLVVGDTPIDDIEAVLLGGDLNGDTNIDYTDLTKLLDDYNKSRGDAAIPGADINGDTNIDYTDLTLLLNNYNRSAITEE